jgi:hypothetical protein
MMATLRAIRARLKLSRAIESAARWALYGSLLACACLVASKFLPVAPELAVAAVVVPLVAAMLAAARRVTILETALLIDGAFRLDERVSSAAELTNGGAMGEALRADAARALAAVDARSVARVRWPRETRLLAIGVALVAAVALAPSPRASGNPAVTAELEAVSRREADRLREAAKDPRVAEHRQELERIAELLRSSDPEQLKKAFVAIQQLESKIGDRLLDRDLPPETARALRELADRAAGAGAGLSIELAAMGIDVEPSGPTGASKRLARAAAAMQSERPEAWEPAKLASGAPVSFNTRPAVEAALRARRWDARYDEIVRRYYEEKP